MANLWSGVDFRRQEKLFFLGFEIHVGPQICHKTDLVSWQTFGQKPTSKLKQITIFWHISWENVSHLGNDFFKTQFARSNLSFLPIVLEKLTSPWSESQKTSLGRPFRAKFVLLFIENRQNLTFGSLCFGTRHAPEAPIRGSGGALAPLRRLRTPWRNGGYHWCPGGRFSFIYRYIYIYAYHIYIHMCK